MGVLFSTNFVTCRALAVLQYISKYKNTGRCTSETEYMNYRNERSTLAVITRKLQHTVDQLGYLGYGTKCPGIHSKREGLLRADTLGVGAPR